MMRTTNERDKRHHRRNGSGGVAGVAGVDVDAREVDPLRIPQTFLHQPLNHLLVRDLIILILVDLVHRPLDIRRRHLNTECFEHRLEFRGVDVARLICVGRNPHAVNVVFIHPIQLRFDPVQPRVHLLVVLVV